MPVIRISETECVVTGKPLMHMSPDFYWKPCTEGINPVFTPSRKPIAYSTKPGETIYPSRLKVQEPEKSESEKISKSKLKVDPIMLEEPTKPEVLSENTEVK